MRAQLSYQSYVMDDLGSFFSHPDRLSLIEIPLPHLEVVSL